VAGGIKARGGMPALEFAHDQLAIAIDVCADLQHGCLAVASVPSAWTWSEPKTPKKLSWGKSPNTRRREVERSHATSNRVSLITTRILKIRDQRLAREIGLLRPEIQRITPQRLCDVSLTPGNVARIFATRTWPTETALAGWACKTRTQKCRRKLSLWKIAQICGNPAEFWLWRR